MYDNNFRLSMSNFKAKKETVFGLPDSAVSSDCFLMNKYSL